MCGCLQGSRYARRRHKFCATPRASANGWRTPSTPTELVALLSKYVSKGKGILQPHNILGTLDEVQVSGGSAFAEGPLLDVLHSSQEAIVLPPFVAIAVRPRPGIWEYVRVNVEQLSVSEYLCFKEELVDGQHNDPYVLELDLEPFTALIPTSESLVVDWKWNVVSQQALVFDFVPRQGLPGAPA